MDPTQTEADKLRFLENLWHVQATYRSRAGQSVVLCADEQDVESKAGRVVIARTYFNVYQRTAFLQEPKKVRVTAYICFSVMVTIVSSDKDCGSHRSVGVSGSDSVRH
jgi:hypothetical protein